MRSKFRNAPQPGRPVEPPPGAGFAHEHMRPDGSRVVVLRKRLHHGVALYHIEGGPPRVDSVDGGGAGLL